VPISDLISIRSCSHTSGATRAREFLRAMLCIFAASLVASAVHGEETADIDVSGDIPDNAQSCAQCHVFGRGDGFDNALERYEALETRDVHRTAALTCKSCHVEHSRKTDTGAIPTAVNCGACHGGIYREYSSGKHAEAFDELGLSACATCHAAHGMSDPSTFDITLTPERGIDGEATMCLSCHFAGSGFESAIYRFAQTISQTDETAVKLDRVLDRCRSFERFLPPIAAFDLSGVRDGSYFKTRAREALHSVGGEVQSNLDDCGMALGDASRVSVRITTLFVSISTVVLVFLMAVAVSKTRKRKLEKGFAKRNGLSGRD
jgi:hypothetical protein